MLPKNWGEPMGAPVIFEKQIEIKLLHSASTEGVTDSGLMTFAIYFPRSKVMPLRNLNKSLSVDKTSVVLFATILG
ncbi:MAG: hypothetical protein P8X74_10875 [Reinekea sp.]